MASWKNTDRITSASDITGAHRHDAHPAGDDEAVKGFYSHTEEKVIF